MPLSRVFRMGFPSLLGVALGLTLLAASAASAITIQDRPNYRPSTDIYFDDSGGGALTGGELLGDTVDSGDFQLNVAYYNAIPADMAAVDQFDDKCLNGTDAGCTTPTGWNFMDPEFYTVHITTDSTANVYANDPSQIVTTADWTITGTWGGGFSHTILYGDLIDNDESLDVSNGDFLDNSGGYHSFPGAGWANANEVWNQQVLPMDIGGYFVSSHSANIGLLSVALVPEPSTALLLFFGLAGLGYRKR